ncbi:class IV adenylate cyclase [Acetivibrio cellulolyticus]|uniref:class IV adenylate cyclase n=1 Tax=Acetivibrio cellulolyticus TaxID=35830 RepID=UPI0001E2BD4E|nr:class IV adenylate cyclase [Acetivibrio cellulolyticus]
MFEVEIKAKVNCNVLSKIKERINLLNPSKYEKVIYHDVYYDNCSNEYYRNEKELRLRKITQGDNTYTNVFTFKDMPFDYATKSKNEYEVNLSDFSTMNDILLKLGFNKDIEFVKECENYYVKFNGKDISITIAYLPDLKEYFIELEILEVCVDENINNLKEILSELLSDFSISEQNVTSKYYTDSIREKRKGG